MLEAMDVCREREDIDVVVFTGAGDKAFCSGGDQNVKGTGGYIGEDGVPRLNVLDLHKKIREIPKPVIAMVNGYAIGGGHVLHVVCDLTCTTQLKYMIMNNKKPLFLLVLDAVLSELIHGKLTTPLIKVQKNEQSPFPKGL